MVMMMMAPPPQHPFPSSSTTPAGTLVVESDGMVGSQHLQPQIQPPIPPIHQREREQQEEEEEEEQQESQTSPPRRRNSLPSSSATHISTRDVNDINSDSRPRNRKWKRAKYVFFWIYDDHWIYVIWLSVVILFLSVMGWIFYKNQQNAVGWSNTDTSGDATTTMTMTTATVDSTGSSSSASSSSSSSHAPPPLPMR